MNDAALAVGETTPPFGPVRLKCSGCPLEVAARAMGEHEVRRVRDGLRAEGWLIEPGEPVLCPVCTNGAVTPAQLAIRNRLLRLEAQEREQRAAVLKLHLERYNAAVAGVREGCGRTTGHDMGAVDDHGDILSCRWCGLGRARGKPGMDGW